MTNNKHNTEPYGSSFYDMSWSNKNPLTRTECKIKMLELDKEVRKSIGWTTEWRSAKAMV